MSMEAVSGLDVFPMLDQLRNAVRMDVPVFVASEEPERYVYDLFQKLPEAIDSECSA